jgi:hypothetical protein
MKKILNVLLFLSVVFMAGSCSESYTFGHDNLFYTGPDGETYCRMVQKYNLSSASGKLPILLSYSGSWDASIVEEDIDWAFIDRTSGNGTGYIRLFYTTNTGDKRTLTLRLACDNGENVEITVTQKAK